MGVSVMGMEVLLPFSSSFSDVGRLTESASASAFAVDGGGIGGLAAVAVPLLLLCPPSSSSSPSLPLRQASAGDDCFEDCTLPPA